MNLFRCARCLYPNTKPDLYFDADGLCSACQAFDRRKLIDWQARQTEFLELVSQHRGKSHDVVVACSGGKDSTWQVVKCLELGLRPLAVTATTDHLSQLGRKNLDNISNLCDHVEITPHKPTRKKIAKFALEEIGDISWCEHHLIWSVPAREALARDIPIVLYGECPQNEYGAGPAGSESQDRLTGAWVHEFGGLLGLRLSDVSDILDIDPQQLEIYRYPTQDSGKAVQAVFMGAYFEWDGYKNFLTAQQNGFTPYHKHVEGSWGNWENLDNMQTGIHDFLRFLKFGYTRADDILSSHIRRGRISRKEAVKFAHLRKGHALYYLGVSWVDILAAIGVSWEQFQVIWDCFANAEVIEWASKRGSYQCFSGTKPERSREDSSALIAALGPCQIGSDSLNVGT